MDGDRLQYILARNINKLCKERGISKAQLSEETGLSIECIISIISLRRWPRPNTLVKIAQALEVDVNTLFVTR